LRVHGNLLVEAPPRLTACCAVCRDARNAIFEKPAY
jgi:hypothetical protein